MNSSDNECQNCRVTKREHFAAQAMQGLISSGFGKTMINIDPKTGNAQATIQCAQVSEGAVALADALIESLNTNQNAELTPVVPSNIQDLIKTESVNRRHTQYVQSWFTEGANFVIGLVGNNTKQEVAQGSNEELNLLRAFVENLSKAKVVKDQDHAEWGNCDDSYSHGLDIAHSDIAKEAKELLDTISRIMEQLK